MSMAGADAVARVSAIQQMMQQLGMGPAAASGNFSNALQTAQNAGAATATSGTTPVSSVSGMPYAAEITAAAKKYGIDPALLAGLVKQESGFNPSIRSGAGAVGLTQLMPATARGLGVTDPTDPVQSLEGGAKYLKEQLDKFGGDERLALAAYNAGPGAVQRYGGVPPYAETQNYVKTVLANRDKYAASGVGSVAPAMPATTPVSAATTLGVNPYLSSLTASLDDTSSSGPTGSSSGLGYPTT